MTNLAIKGHPTRGKEVIEILEMLGGFNKHNYCADSDSLCFYVDNENNVIYYDWVKCYEDEDILIIFTLEEFLEKFPYKVGDKVSSKYLKNYAISKMEWGSVNNRVIYKLQGMGWYSADELQPYKDETMDKANKVVFDANAQCCDISNEIIKKETMENGFIYDEIDFNRCPCTDKVQLILGDDYEIKVEDGKTYVVKKQPEYPKTYEECCKVLNTYCTMPARPGYKEVLIAKFQELLICRDAYWKIAGDWKPDWLNKEQDKFVIYTHNNDIQFNSFILGHNILAFPTFEIRDMFYENFKELIEECKELL